MAFDLMSWCFGFALTRAANAGLDAAKADELDTALGQALARWAAELPDTVALASPAALFPAHEGLDTPPPALVRLRERLAALQIPTPAEWLAMLKAQRAVVAGRLGRDAHAFFRFDAAVVEPHLSALAARLHRACAQDDTFFKHRVLQGLEAQTEQLDAVRDRLDAVQNDFAELVGDIVEGRIDDALSRRDRRRLQRQVDDAVDRALESQRVRFEKAGVALSGQWLIFDRARAAFERFVDDPKQVFRANMDGPALFDMLDAHARLPPSVRAAGLGDLFLQVGPYLAALLVASAEAVSSATRKLDDAIGRLEQVAGQLEELSSKLIREDAQVTDDPVLARVRQGLLNKLWLELDIAGLHADRELRGQFDDFFVCPALVEPLPHGQSRTFDTAAEVIDLCLSDGQRVAAEGAPGSGKSTWTRWLQRRAMDISEDRLAVRVPLHTLKEPLPSVQAVVRAVGGPHLAEELSAELIRGWLDRGSVAFLLDGFDEVPLERRGAVAAWLLGLAVAAARAPVVLTSRPLTTTQLERLPEAWVRCQIAPFDAPRIEDYVSRWFRHSPVVAEDARAVDVAAMVEGWRSDPTLQTLTENPLLLTTLLVVHGLDGELPNGRARLYQRYVDGMLGQWDRRRKVAVEDVGLNDTQRRRLLRLLAVHLFMADVEEIERAAAVEFLEAHVPEAARCGAILDAIEERSGLVLGPGVYHFAHKSLLEFLVAEAVVEGDIELPDGDLLDRSRLLRSRHDDRWRSVLFFWCGMAPVGQFVGLLDDCLQRETGEDARLALSLAYDQMARLNRSQLGRVLASSVERACWGSQDLGEVGWSRGMRWLGETYELDLFNLHSLLSLDGSRDLGKALVQMLPRVGQIGEDLVHRIKPGSELAYDLAWGLLSLDGDYAICRHVLARPVLERREALQAALVGRMVATRPPAEVFECLSGEHPILSALAALSCIRAIVGLTRPSDLWGFRTENDWLESSLSWVGATIPNELIQRTKEAAVEWDWGLGSRLEFLHAERSVVADRFDTEEGERLDLLKGARSAVAGRVVTEEGERLEQAKTLLDWLDRLLIQRDGDPPERTPETP